MGAIVNSADLGPVGNLLAYAIAVYATFEGLLLAELAAGNAIAGTPMAACGRVALGMACTLARSCISPKSSSTHCLAPLARV